MLEVGMFVYPWAIRDMDAFFRDYAATGSNALAPAMSYHHGTVLEARTGRVTTLQDAALSFIPNPELYGDLRPAVHREAAEAGVVHSLRSWSRDTGRHFSAWTVVLHNSTIGAARPDLCVMNHAGDRYPHALCPSHPEVRQYGEALVQDIIDQFSPDSLLVESAAYRTALHGDHHEIAGCHVGTAALWLLSLCFCPHCLEAASVRPGLDALKARDTCGQLVRELLNTNPGLDEDETARVSALLLEYPELHLYQLERQRRVADFIQALGAVARERSVEYRVIPSSTPYPLRETFLEGFSYRENRGNADVFMPLLYSQGETWDRTNLSLRHLDPDTATGMILTLHPARYPERHDFLAAIREAASSRVPPRAIYVYNYSIASEERLSWLPEAVETAGRSGSGPCG